MGRIKKALAAGIITSFLVLPSFATNLNEKNVNYQVICGGFHVGDADYNVTENDKEYNIELHGQPTGFFKILGLEYQFNSEGYKKDNQLYPKKFKRVNKSGVSEENKNGKTSEVTDITFDYENLEAKAYAYKETENQLIIKYDTRENPTRITEDTKDFLTISEEMRRKDLKDSYEIKTVAKGKVQSFKVRKIGEEKIKMNGNSYNTVVYETEVTSDMFGIDSKSKIWINQDEDHTILKWWIENGPLWTSIVMQYNGKKSELKN